MTIGLRVALVSEHASPLAVLGGTDAGGQNVHVAELAMHLARLGSEVVVYTRRDDPSLPQTVPLAPGVDVVHVDAGPPEPMPKDALYPLMPEFASFLERDWSTRRPDVVHSHFWMSGVASRDAAQRTGVPWAHTYHALGVVKRLQQGEDDTSPIARLDEESAIARHADLLLATSLEECRVLQAMGGGGRCVRVPCGVDLSTFRPCGATWPRRAGYRRIVVVSRLVPRKGIGNVIAALASLPGTELLIAGGPPDGLVEDDPEATRLRATAERLGVADRVEFLGSLRRPEVAALLRSADVACCCPWYEPFGLVAVEAMASGVPVVATNVGGLAETVLDGITGIRVPPRDAGAIADAVRVLLQDEELRRRMAGHAVHRARRFSWQTVAADTHAHLARLARRRQLAGRATNPNDPEVGR